MRRQAVEEGDVERAGGQEETEGRQDEQDPNATYGPWKACCLDKHGL